MFAEGPGGRRRWRRDEHEHAGNCAEVPTDSAWPRRWRRDRAVAIWVGAGPGSRGKSSAPGPAGGCGCTPRGKWRGGRENGAAGRRCTHPKTRENRTFYFSRSRKTPEEKQGSAGCPEQNKLRKTRERDHHAALRAGGKACAELLFVRRFAPGRCGGNENKTGSGNRCGDRRVLLSHGLGGTGKGAPRRGGGGEGEGACASRPLGEAQVQRRAPKISPCQG
jgi:hypothetical protein